MKALRRIGITLGDVNGIGPEVALKAVYGARGPAGVQLVLVGSAGSVRRQARALKLPVPPPWEPAPGKHPTPRVATWDPDPHHAPKPRPGKIEGDAARAAAAWIRAAAGACLDGRLDAMVTAPISKEGFHKAGINVPGHTEMLAELTGTKRFAMMLFGGPLHVTLVTRHVPIARVASALTRAKVLEAIRITGEALPWLGLRGRRIAVCGLNPHAGDGGKIGREEIRFIAPAIRAARKEGFDAVGPVPADAVFYHALRGRYDAVVAMYHDQGLGPLKMLAFDCGVNVTLGLPIVRTSPDHGTAFDIAGRGKANPSSMAIAVQWAIRLAGRRNPWV